MTVPLVDLRAQHADISAEIGPALADVLAAGAFVGGPAVGAFEEEYARFVGAAECVGVGNGTDAIELALRAAGVEPGSEVVVPANTFIATAEAVLRAGATPVFADVDSTHLLLDPRSVREVCTDRTVAIVPVHLYGQVAFVEALVPIAAQVGAVIVEDAAQAQGATRGGRRAGSLGLAAGTSFYPGKNLGAAGDAGAVTTSDPDVARRVRLLGAHGSARKYVHEIVGFNSRLDTIQAVVLLAKLRRLEEWNARRQEAARRYGELLRGVEGVTLPTSAPGNVDVWHLYVVRVAERDRVLARLIEAGVGAGVHYPTPLHLTEALAHLGPGRGSFPVAEETAHELLSLPIFPHISAAQQERVAESLARALG